MEMEEVLFLYFIELFCTIHNTLGVMVPLSNLLKEKGHTFWTVKRLMFIRILFLLIVTPVFPLIFMVDFFGIFIGTFALSYLSQNRRMEKEASTVSTVKTTVGTITCPKCGREAAYGNTRCPDCGADLVEAKLICKKCNTENEKTYSYCKKCGSLLLEPKEYEVPNCPVCNTPISTSTKFCANCGTNIENLVVGVEQESTAPPKQIQISGMLTVLTIKSVNDVLEDRIKEELQGNKDITGLTLKKIEDRKNRIFLIEGIICFLLITIYMAYHTHAFLIFLILSITLGISFYFIKNYSIEKYLKKEITKRPDEKISYIVTSVVEGATPKKIGNKIFRIAYPLIMIFILSLVFAKPHIIYEKQVEGYAVRYYTIGLWKKDKTLEIPEEYKQEKVTGIRGDVFKNIKSLKEVTLPSTITEIRGGAFQGCSNLEKINLPVGITEIHGSTFEDCFALKSIVIPSGVTRIGGSAFRNCRSLESASIPKTVTEIGSSAFRNTAIKSVCISSSTYVNERAFKETYPSIYYYENNCMPADVTIDKGDLYDTGY